MGKVYSIITKPIRTFNIENRAHKVITKEKPVPAPQYPSTAKQKELVNKLHPDFMEKHYKKNAELDDRLKDIYVISTDPKTKPKDTVPPKPLPLDRTRTPVFEFGFYEVQEIPEGKCSLRQALAFIVKHNKNPAEYTVEKIALEYKLDKQLTANILDYFRIPNVIRPKKVDMIEELNKQDN
ncbi:NADH dehydrogenase [ubiquinone] 1 alpha subcomplex assembly factor 4 [Ptiloglossa arizonensis]|uniref:NADH dehydrogenase [ubiquinone] 1 alpha subcomplex assembly factor 4 n=1 Tax=Ptiloglossa arizonensis TaxID=3350558 RepID=UPI003F9F64C8